MESGRYYTFGGQIVEVYGMDESAPAGERWFGQIEGVTGHGGWDDAGHNVDCPEYDLAGRVATHPAPWGAERGDTHD